jgi:hypothetical protein
MIIAWTPFGTITEPEIRSKVVIYSKMHQLPIYRQGSMEMTQDRNQLNTWLDKNVQMYRVYTIHLLASYLSMERTNAQKVPVHDGIYRPQVFSPFVLHVLTNFCVL